MVFRRENLQRRIEKLHEYRRDLSATANVALKSYVSDRRIKYAGERVLFLICENILDFLDHVLASRFSVVSDRYEDIIRNALGKGIISRELFDKVAGIGGLRNVLAHEYLDLDDETIYQHMQRMNDTIDGIMGEFEKYLRDND